MKRNGTEALSPIKPPRTVHVRLSQADTQPALRAPAVRLSQADTVVAPTPDVPAPTEAAGWVTSSVTDLPPPECTPCPPLEELPPPSCGMSASSCCGTLPAPVSGPAPTIHIMHGDIFARARIAAVQSRVAAGSLVPFHDGSYWCSKCPRRGFQSAKGLMRHITHLHTGSVVDEDTCALLEAIERVTCSTPSCGGLRRSGARLCSRCGMATPARPPAVDDLIMGAFGAPTAEAGAAGAEENDTPPIPTARVELPWLQLPENFTQRIRSLPANTLLHRFGISSSVPRRSASFFAWPAIERFAMFSLTPQREPTAPVPVPLLVRIARPPRGLSLLCFPLKKRRTSPGPRSFFPLPLLEGRLTAPPPPGEDWDLPFAGLHYAALTAPGPSGTRRTHHGYAQCAPADSRQQAPCHAVGVVLHYLCGWALPAARWLTRTQLCLQRGPLKWASSCGPPNSSSISTR